MPRGGGHLPHPPGRAVKRAAGCTAGSETLGPCVSALEPPRSSWGTYRALHAAPPFSFYAAMFLCCQVGPLGPFRFRLGEGQGSRCPVPWAPAWERGHQVPCIEPSSPPGFPRGVPGRLSPGTVSRLLVEEKRVPHTSSVGTDADPTPSASEGRGRGGDGLPLVRAAGVCPSGPNPAPPPDSSAEGCSRVTQGSGPGSPSSQVWGHKQDPFMVPYKYVYVYIDF